MVLLARGDTCRVADERNEGELGTGRGLAGVASSRTHDLQRTHWPGLGTVGSNLLVNPDSFLEAGRRVAGHAVLVREKRGRDRVELLLNSSFAAQLGILEQGHERQHPADLAVVLIDLAAVTFIDSSGLHALIAAHEHLGDRLSIILSPQCTQLVEIAMLRDALPIIEG